MISVENAVKIAREWMKRMYQPEEIPELMLEEVKRTADDHDWLITMGYRSVRPYVNITGGTGLLGIVPRYERQPREYKVLKIDGATSSVESMEIRDLG